MPIGTVAVINAVLHQKYFLSLARMSQISVLKLLRLKLEK